MPSKGLPDNVKQRISDMKFLENKQYKEIGEAILKDFGVSVTDNMIREIIRDVSHGAPAKTEKGTAIIRANTEVKKQQLLAKLDEVIEALDSSDPKQAIAKVQAIKAALWGLTVGQPNVPQNQTQINVQVNIFRDKFDKTNEWLLTRSGLSREKLDDYEMFMRKEEKVIDAKYEVKE